MLAVGKAANPGWPPGSSRHPGRDPRENLAWCANPSCSPWGWQGPHALWAQGDPRRPAGLRQELLTALQGAPAGQSQALWQFGPKKPVGQAAGKAVMGCLPALPAGLAQPRPTPRLTAFTEGSPPAGWAGAGPADMVTGCPMLAPALLPTAWPKPALGTP